MSTKGDKTKKSLKRVLLETLLAVAAFQLAIVLIGYISNVESFETIVMKIIVVDVVFCVLFLLYLGWLFLTRPRFIGAAVIWIKDDKAYLPMLRESESDTFLEAAPVTTSTLRKVDLVASLENILAARYEHDPQLEDKTRQPTLERAKTSSYSKFDAGFFVRWTSKAIMIDMVQPTDGLESENILHKTLAADIPLDSVIDTILEGLADNGATVEGLAR